MEGVGPRGNSVIFLVAHAAGAPSGATSDSHLHLRQAVFRPASPIHISPSLLRPSPAPRLHLPHRLPVPTSPQSPPARARARAAAYPPPPTHLRRCWGYRIDRDRARRRRQPRSRGPCSYHAAAPRPCPTTPAIPTAPPVPRQPPARRPRRPLLPLHPHLNRPRPRRGSCCCWWRSRFLLIGLPRRRCCW